MAIEPIENDEKGDSVRAKLNAAIDGVNSLAAQKPQAYAAVMPDAVRAAWAFSAWRPDEATLYFQNGACVASVGKSPLEVFNLVSSAVTAPDATYYVATNGSDANNGLSRGAAFATLSRPVVVAKAAGYTKIKVIVAAGEYPRFANPTAGGSIVIDIDTAWFAENGRVRTGTWDAYSPPSVDATYPNTYSWTLSSVARVCDLLTVDADANYLDLTNVTTAALCNITPNSWALEGGKLYVRRRDGVAVMRDNTRVFRSSSGNLRMTGASVNLYVGGLTGADGFDFEGGDSGGPVTINPTALPFTKKCASIENATMKYGGGVGQPDARGITINSYDGLVFLKNCYLARNITDGVNVHNQTVPMAAARVTCVTLNCTAQNNGGAQVSCQPYTLHEDVLGVDFASNLFDGYGGGIRNINASVMWAAGTVIANDRGDRTAPGGALTPTAVRLDDTARLWLDTALIRQNQGYELYAASAGTAIYIRNMLPSRAPNSGAGAIASY